MNQTFPEELFDLVFIPHLGDRLNELAELAETEDWEYRHAAEHHAHPVLYNYLRFTYRRLAEEEKVSVADDGRSIAMNIGLVTDSQEPIFMYCTQNRLEGREEPWHFTGWKRKGEHELTRFSALPEMAHYFDDPKNLVLDVRKELRANVEHIIQDNKERFPKPYNQMETYQLQTFLKGAIDNARERARRNYKTAVPQYYRGKVQLLLPLCLSRPSIADLALVVEDHGAFYRASTCFTLDMAYNNARQLARPDRDWLQP
ncbi:DUF3825 domain-containing protein [Salinisphaera sp. Q1T1-3]|uniref:DUF3825 domain-containing protein n=1 Tax=Salinisphaera sp. Q1T1-3 TaxID=2321229 RepID=UPI001313F716|nr:DUF3825 domain-containing protein [Salinisphaera sp. Q1T1-3]